MPKALSLESLKDRVNQANNAVWSTGKIEPPTITKSEYKLLNDAARNYADKALTVIN